MDKKLKVVILGKGAMLANLIRGAILSDVNIVGVLRYERNHLSPLMLKIHDFFKPSPELTLIKRHRIKDLKFNSANSENFRKFLIKNNVDIVLVGTWSEKISKQTIDIPQIGTINVHPSLLPKYRGVNPYLETIRNGEKYTGITFHIMTEKLDAGGILAQEKIEILDSYTGLELRNKTAFRARFLCEGLLEQLKQGCVIPIPQDENEATYFKDIAPEEMTLDFTKETSDEIIRHVRAFHPFRPTYIQESNTFWLVDAYKIKKSELTGQPYEYLHSDKNSKIIACADRIAVEFNGLKKYNNLPL